MVAISFQPWKAAKVEQGCCQTIRKQRKRPLLVGQRLQLYQQQRVKGASRKLFAFDPLCSDVNDIFLWWDQGAVQVHFNEGSPLTESDREALALADGFESLDAFEQFFFDTHLSKDDHFTGQLIKWTHLQPYFPSNRSSGFAFEGKFCARCTKGPKGDSVNSCSVMLDAWANSQTQYWYYQDGEPTCGQFRDRTLVTRNGSTKGRAERRIHHPQLNIFTWATAEGVLQ